MDKKIINTPKAPAPVGPYSQAVEIDGWIFCSGQIAINPETNDIIINDIERQSHRIMENIKAILQEVGLTFQNVIKTTIYLTNMDYFSQVNTIYAQYFEKEPPARSTIAVAGLPKGVQVEIEVVARR